MQLSELEREEIKLYLPKVSPDKVKDIIKNIDDSYIKLAKAFLIAYFDFKTILEKVEDSILKEKLEEYLDNYRELEYLYYLVDSYDSSFNKTKYKNRIVSLIQGREASIIELVTLYYKIADLENMLSMTGFSSSFF